MEGRKRSAAIKAVHQKSLAKRMYEHKTLYLFLLPAVALVVVFNYQPMYGAVLAFKDFKYNLGILGSPWIGVKYFERFLASSEFWNTVRNTVVISALKILFCFPAPILLALLLNELKLLKYKRFVQTVSYLPHFVSWVVVVSIMMVIFTPYGGIINNLRKSMGLEAIFYMGEKTMFYPLIVSSEIWKGVGWGSILYLSSIAGINPELHEAAICDGAGRLKCVWYVTLPCIKFIIGFQFIMSVSGLLGTNFDQLLLMQQPSNLELSEVIDTYVLAKGLKQGQFGLATAIGLFRTVISFALLLSANFFSKKAFDISIF